MMKIGPALTQRVGTALVITPQLRQAIKLMQLSALELEAEIQAFTETNPLLEIVEPGDDGDAPADSDAGADDAGTGDAAGAGGDGEHEDGDRFTVNGDAEPAEDAAPAATDTFELEVERADPDAPAADSDWADAIPEDLATDADWDDVFTPEPLIGREEVESGEERDAAAESLADHLRWQLNLTPMSDRDRDIALAIIDGIDATGFLTTSVDDLLATVNATRPAGTAEATGGAAEAGGAGSDADAVTADEVEAVLHRVQQFDPPGIGARDLRECLLIQLRQLPPGTRRRLDAIEVVDRHIELLAGRNMAQLSRSTGLDEAGLRDVLRLIRTLNPRPGSAFDASPAEYVQPDVIVRKVNGRWQVELNAAASPRLRIVHEYLAYVDDRSSKSSREAASYVTEKHREAKYFMAGLKHRNDTLFRVAVKIVEFQRSFLDYGPEALKPLVLRDIADQIGVHEATVSRVTRRKYMHTPRGVFELKYFFGGHVGTTDGGVVASKAVHERIRAVLLAENPRKPLSDQDIVTALKGEGIDVARRTVTKYRKAMGIPSSTDRRRLA
jgi:RNA polymerase sigma-54 factor